MYALEDAEEVRLVDDLSDEDRLPVSGLHLHAVEGGRVSLTKLASGHYAVGSPGAVLARHSSLLDWTVSYLYSVDKKHIVNGTMPSSENTVKAK
jgi:hypothetical protein